MRIFLNLIALFGMATCLAVVTPAFAESAPVYDVDSMPQSEDMDGGAQQELPPPPPPGQEGAFVPSQTSPANSPSISPRQNSVNLSEEQRLRKLEQQMNNMQSNNLSTRIEALQTQVQSLRGQVEQLSHQLQQIETQQKSMYSDLDKRVSQQSKKTVKPEVSGENTEDVIAVPVVKSNSSKNKTSTTKSTKATMDASETIEKQPNVEEEQQIYQTAYNLIKEKKYEQAVNALQDMLKKYPSGQFAANAHYWLGELYGLLGKHDQALNEFSTVVKNYASSPRVADAQLKIGLIYATQLKWVEAKAAFKKVVNRYPGSASSRLAHDQLKQIKQAGH